MKLASFEVTQIALRRRTPFVSSRAIVNERRIIVVAARDVDGHEGWAECSAPEEPRYSEEWTNSAWGAVNNLLIPLLLQQDNVTPRDITHIFSVYRGNRMAKAAVEAACWDLEARRAGQPLWKFLNGSGEPIPCGVALGIASSVDSLLRDVELEVEAGYRRIKLKIRPGWDIAVLRAVRSRFPGVSLMVDANGAYTVNDLDLLSEFDDLNLLMIEQPFAPDDACAYIEARDQLKTRICLDETIVSVTSTLAALRLTLCDVVNVKLGRVGGYSEARSIVDLCARYRVPAWCGGQHEAGVGKAHNLALASLMPRAFPAELSSSSRYWSEDIIAPPITVSDDGFILPPTDPGIGFEINRSRIKALAERSEHHTARNAQVR